VSKEIVIGITDCGAKYSNYEKWISDEPDVKVIRLDFRNLDEIEKCNGIVLTGGDDVHPRFYGNNELSYPNAPKRFAEKRDEFEIEVFQRAQKSSMPVLGICRGLQLTNCVLGGTLTQDLGDLNEIHRRPPQREDDKIHTVKIEPDTILNAVSGVQEGDVNSSHHQSIDKLGSGLRINCRADDGTIEGIERSDSNKPFLLAVQWHPERMKDQDSPLSKNIRDSFLEAARKR
jgi:putative glutamine amidotransferase